MSNLPATYAVSGRFQKILAVCGISAVVLYLGSLLILGSIEPGYSHLHQVPSELGGANAVYAVYMNMVFHIVGILTIMFACGLHFSISQGRGSIAGPVVLAILGLSVFLAGFFPCDAGCAGLTLSAKLHNLVGLPGLLSSPAAPLLMYKRLRQDPRWQGYEKFSLLAGIVQIVGIFTLPLFLALGNQGLSIRIMLVAQLAWPLVMAIKMLALSRSGQQGVFDVRIG